jgi:hypothetical protein
LLFYGESTPPSSAYTTAVDHLCLIVDDVDRCRLCPRLSDLAARLSGTLRPSFVMCALEPIRGELRVGSATEIDRLSAPPAATFMGRRDREVSYDALFKRRRYPWHLRYRSLLAAALTECTTCSAARRASCTCSKCGVPLSGAASAKRVMLMAHLCSPQAMRRLCNILRRCVTYRDGVVRHSKSCVRYSRTNTCCLECGCT